MLMMARRGGAVEIVRDITMGYNEEKFCTKKD
jgi:hypothetical protein